MNDFVGIVLSYILLIHLIKGLMLTQEGCIENGKLKALPNDIYNEGCVLDVMHGIKVCLYSVDFYPEALKDGLK